MVVEMYADLTYLPLDAAGLARMTDITSAAVFLEETSSRLASAGMHHAILVHPVLDLAGLGFHDRLGHIMVTEPDWDWA